MSSDLNPRTKHYEWFGPPGTMFISTMICILVYSLFFGCSEQTGGCPPPNLAAIPDRVLASISQPTWWKSLWDTEATLLYLGWYAFTVVAWFILPGNVHQGLVMRDGNRKQYTMNAFATFTLALGITTGYIYRFGPESFTFIYEKWPGFITAALLMAFTQATAVYIASFIPGKLLALGGNTGNPAYDWFVGRELNPSIGSFDIKSFNELRPGLMFWVLSNISFVCEQAVRNGGFANVTDSMWLVLIFETWYVADALYNEDALFSTMDIIHDGFGFMLSFGDLVWVPFTYSVQGRYLAFHPVKLGPALTAAIFVLNFTGFYIFRVSNLEKHVFRHGSNPKNLKFMTTSKGSKLITSGWWGTCQHPNYLGDLMMGLAWCLPTGFESIIPYFYIIYFTILLLHRQIRDDDSCSKKYGEDWVKYKKLVPYRIIPYVY